MSLILQGSTSGSVTLQEPAVAGTTVINLPATSGTVALTASPTFTGTATIPTATVTTLNAPSGVLATQNGMTGIAKAWVSFDGATGTINGTSFNVSSVTRSSTGNYVINFTTALPNANYSFALSAFNGDSGNVYYHAGYVSPPSTTQFKTYVYNFGGSPSDVAYTSAVFFSS